MIQQCNVVVLVFSVFCLTTESKMTRSIPDNDELGLFSNEISSQIFNKIKASRMRSNTAHDSYVQSVDTINQITNSIPGTNNVDDLVQAQVMKYLDKFSDNLSEEESQLSRFSLETTLKKVDEKLNKGKARRLDELAKQVLSFDSPFQGCSKDPYPPSESKTIKKYEINLDLEPEERWKEVLQEKSVQVKKLADFFEEIVGEEAMSVVDTAMIWLHHTLPQEYYRELNGISAASGISVARVTLYNIFYEIFSVCTSIVMEAEDGKMYHGRNLDFGAFLGWDAKNHTWLLTEIMRPLIIKVDFVKNSNLLYSAVTYAGYTGILTGVRKNAFSLTIDERFIWNGGYIGLAEWIVGLHDESWLGILTRRVMESAASYNQAQQLLTNSPLVAPVYFILAGNTSEQGSIITRGRRDADIWRLGSRYPQQKGSWFLVETNFDHWKSTPFYDQRRQYAVQCMDEIGQQKPLETLYRVLSTTPVLNKETTLTAVMDVREGLLQVWERDCPDPCWPL